MAELTSMRNIGKTMEEKLKAVDICTAEELSIGVQGVQTRLKRNVRFESK